MRDGRGDIEDAFLNTPNRGGANPRFVKMCQELYIKKVTGRITQKHFLRCCDRLERLARLRKKTFG